MKSRYSNLVSDQRGVTTIEFAFVAAPFIALLFGIVQLALIFFAGNLLDMGVKQAARFVLTGQAQEDSWALPKDDETPLEAKIAKFRTEVCNYAGILLNCDDIKLDVRILSNFSDTVPSIPMENGQIKDEGFGFSLGARNEIIMIRAMYLLPTYSDILGAALINAGTNKRLLVSTTVFVNEPFD